MVRPWVAVLVLAPCGLLQERPGSSRPAQEPASRPAQASVLSGVVLRKVEKGRAEATRSKATSSVPVAERRLADALVVLVPLQRQDLSRIPPPQVPGSPRRPSEGDEEEAKGAVIVLEGGKLSPRIQVIRDEETIILKNEDGVASIQGKAGNWSFSFNMRQQKMDLCRVFGEPMTKAMKDSQIVRITNGSKPEEVAWVMLLPSGEHRITGRDGGFRFDALPPGLYRVDVWDDGARKHSQEITLAADKPLKIEVELR